MIDPTADSTIQHRMAGTSILQDAAYDIMVLKVWPVTVGRDWSSAKIWLYRELSGETDDGLGSLETAR